MKEEDIIKLWKCGLDIKHLAKVYKRTYNQNIKLIRASVRHRHDGKFITNYEALAYVQRVIYNYIMRRKNK